MKNGSTKRPAFTFYPRDWLGDLKLQSCSWESKGLWIQLLCYLHDADEYGKFILNGESLSKKSVGNLVNMPSEKFMKCFDELIRFGVIKQDDQGVYYSKRMVEDERVRKEASEFGRKGGGNPTLKGTYIGESKVPIKGPINPISSSSSDSILPSTNVEGVDGTDVPPTQPPKKSENKKTTTGVGREGKFVIPEELHDREYMRQVVDHVSKKNHIIFRCACQLYRNLMEAFPGYISVKELKIKNFIPPIYHMINLEKRDPYEMDRVQKWAIQDSFHSKNIRNTTYFRRHYERMRDEAFPTGRPEMKTSEKVFNYEKPY